MPVKTEAFESIVKELRKIQAENEDLKRAAQYKDENNREMADRIKLLNEENKMLRAELEKANKEPCQKPTLEELADCLDSLVEPLRIIGDSRFVFERKSGRIVLTDYEVMREAANALRCAASNKCS